MTTEADLIRLLSDAQRTGSRTLDATTLTAIDRATAYRVVAGTQAALGETTGMLKTTVLASLVAYARAQQPGLPLAAGTIITTGSLCGLVLTSGAGHVVGKLGTETVELDLV